MKEIKMKERIAKLIDLKSLLSIIVVLAYTVFVYLGIVESEYKDIVIMVMTFYFAKTAKKEVE